MCDLTRGLVCKMNREILTDGEKNEEGSGTLWEPRAQCKSTGNRDSTMQRPLETYSLLKVLLLLPGCLKERTKIVYKYAQKALTVAW